MKYPAQRAIHANRSGFAPVIRPFLIIQMPDTRDQRFVAVPFGPLDGLVLGFGIMQNMVGMVFDHVILNGVAFRTALRAWLDVDIRHFLAPFAK
jgi:hypothetical protein